MNRNNISRMAATGHQIGGAEQTCSRGGSGRTKRGIMALMAMIAVALTACFGAAGCRPEGQGTQNRKLNVVAAIFPLYDFARQVAGERADVSMLMPPGVETHTYEPTPQDVKRIVQCDLFLYTGGESDVWVKKLIASSGIDPAKTLRLMDAVEGIEESSANIVDNSGEHHHEHGDDDHDHGDEHGGGDPLESAGVHEHEHAGESGGAHREDEHDHGGESGGEHDDHHQDRVHAFDEHIWTSPVNAIRMCEVISGKLSEFDPGHAGAYRSRLEAYRGELKKLDTEIRTIVKNGVRKEIVVADRFPLIYFTAEYGIRYTAAYPGCAAETDPKPQTVASIIERVKSEIIPYIFYIEFSNERLATLVAEETGAQKLLFHSVHNVTREAFESGASYLSYMRQNIDNLRKALGA